MRWDSVALHSYLEAQPTQVTCSSPEAASSLRRALYHRLSSGLYGPKTEWNLRLEGPVLAISRHASPVLEVNYARR